MALGANIAAQEKKEEPEFATIIIYGDKSTQDIYINDILIAQKTATDILEHKVFSKGKLKLSAKSSFTNEMAQLNINTKESPILYIYVTYPKNKVQIELSNKKHFDAIINENPKIKFNTIQTEENINNPYIPKELSTPFEPKKEKTIVIYTITNFDNVINKLFINNKLVAFIPENEITYYTYHSKLDLIIESEKSYAKVLKYPEEDTIYFLYESFHKFKPSNKNEFETRLKGKIHLMTKNYYEEDKDNPIKDWRSSLNNIEKSGSGLFIAQPGYVLTNYHVVKGAKEIEVSNLNNEANKSSIAELVMYDETSDLALLRLKDTISTTLVTPFVFDKTVQPLATNVYVLGYPLITSMGKDVKLTNGVISSKNGFKGNTQSYQISAPVQPGNSGGPLFDNKGNIIGLINAKHRDTENVSYAIKSYVIQQFLENAETPILLNQQNTLKDKPIEQIVSSIQPFVVIIKTK